MKRLLTTIMIALLFTLQQSIAATPDGKVTTYYDNGNKKADKHYKDGTPVGDWKSWHTNGKSYISMSFLGDTGQIEKVDMLYPDGALYYSGVATKAVSKAGKPKKKCGAIVTSKGPKDTDGVYHFNIQSYYQDGTCEKAEKGNMMRVIARLYFSINDETTGNRYNFPWGERPEFIKEKSE